MKTKTIVLVGQPNAGKSTLFNVLSDIKTSTSNFAGTTVQVKETYININGDTYHLIDLPGIYSLNPIEPAEAVTFDFLMNNEVDLVVNVVDATLLSRSLELTVELIELGLPMVIALNMQDEAERHGVRIDGKALEQILNIKVVSTTAIFGKGVKQLVDTIYQNTSYPPGKPASLDYTYHLEKQINELTYRIIENNKSLTRAARFFAIKSIENPVLIPRTIYNKIEGLRNKIAHETEREHKKDAFETISYERHHLAMKLSHQISTIKPRKTRAFSEKTDDYLLHPLWGYLFMLITFFIYFFLIFSVGNLISMVLEAPLAALVQIYQPLKMSQPFLWYTIDGFAQGIIGGIGIVLPYFLPLLFLTALLEETGYLSRIAFLLDGIFHKIGLHGKSVIPFIMGFGCSVPAIFATRIIENKRDRIVTAVLINFIPCSARISVIFALSAAFTGPVWAAGVFFLVILILAVVGKLLSLIIAQPTGLILEIPTLKQPSIKITVQKTYNKLKEFFRSALPFLVAGSIILGWIQYLNYTSYFDILFSPVVTVILGLPEKLGTTLIFGFLRKELIIVMASQAMGVSSLSQLPLTLNQTIVFIVFTILYIPCVSTLAVFWREFGLKTVFLSVILCLIVALLSAFALKLILNI